MPRSLASYHQQLGRAGRRKNDSLSLMIVHPEGLERKSVKLQEFLGANPGQDIQVEMNEDLFVKHLECAASEIPIRLEGDADWFICESIEQERITDLCQDKLVFDPVPKAYICPPKYQGYPAGSFSLRGNDDEKEGYRVVTEDKKEIEVVELSRVPFTLYEGPLRVSLRLTDCDRRNPHSSSQELFGARDSA